MSPELKDVSEFYANQLDSKEREIKRLRDYVAQLENAGRRISGEYSEQLRVKAAEIERLRRALLCQERLGKKLETGVSEKGRKAENESELERLRSYILELENSGKMSRVEYAGQIAEKEKQIRRLVNMLRLRDESNRALSERLDSKAIAERDYVERLKRAISRKEEFNREIIEKLTEDLSRKSREVDRLGDSAMRHEKLLKSLEIDADEYRRRQESLEAFLLEKDSMMNKLEKNFSQQLRNKEQELERLGSELRKQLDSKPAAKSGEEIAALKIRLGAREDELDGVLKELANLKEQNRIAMKRLDERQRLFAESEKAYNGLVNSLQLQHEKRVKELMSVNSRREVELRTEVERLKAERREKETLLAEKESRIDETLLQFSETSRKLLELKGVERAADSGTTMTELKEKEAEINSLLKEADERIKAAVAREHDVERREGLLIREQEAISSEISILRNAGVEVQKDREYLKAKIRQHELPKKEAMLEQPALVGDEAAPEAPAEYAGEVQPENAGAAEALPVQEAVEDASGKSEVLEILRRPGNARVALEEPLAAEPKAKEGVKSPLFTQAKSRVKQLPRPPVRSIRAKVERPKVREALLRQAEKKEAFPEVGGYGEVHEIESIISIGLQHGDSIERIRSSLEASGYSRQGIEKAFRQARKH